MALRKGESLFLKFPGLLVFSANEMSGKTPLCPDFAWLGLYEDMITGIDVKLFRDIVLVSMEKKIIIYRR